MFPFFFKDDRQGEVSGATNTSSIILGSIYSPQVLPTVSSSAGTIPIQVMSPSVRFVVSSERRSLCSTAICFEVLPVVNLCRGVFLTTLSFISLPFGILVIMRVLFFAFVECSYG